MIGKSEKRFLASISPKLSGRFLFWRSASLGSQLREIAACQFALARMDRAVSSRAPWALPTFSYRVRRRRTRCKGLRLAACVPIFGSTTIILGFEKEHFCQGSIRLQTSRADIVGDTRRASEIWSAPVGGDSRAGTGLSVSTNRVTSKMPPAIRTSATRVFVMARSAFIVPKRGRGGRATSKRRSGTRIFGLPSGTSHHLIETGLAAQGCDCPRHRSRPTCQGIGGVKGKLRFPGGTHSVATPSVRPQNLQTIGLV